MTYQDFGFTEELEAYRKHEKLDSFRLGRISLEHKERYVIKTPTEEFDAELIGNLRFTAQSRYDFPAVGDWVAFSEYDQGKALIHALYPRSSIIERQAVAKTGQAQIIAVNIDYGLIIQAVDRDFNINRLERYLTICNASGVNPIIVLSKIDLVSQSALQAMQQQVEERISNVPIIAVSMHAAGYAALEEQLMPGKTYCLLGSSGVGKSTLLNVLSGKELMKTRTISSSVNKGRHTTSHRELIVLPKGGILIDNPGMREVGIVDSKRGLETTFESISDYASDCRFKDCTHAHEKGCAVLQALESGDIDEASYANFIKMEKEKQHFESDVYERRQKDKQFGKMVNEVMKQKRKKKF